MNFSKICDRSQVKYTQEKYRAVSSEDVVVGEFDLLQFCAKILCIVEDVGKFVGAVSIKCNSDTKGAFPFSQWNPVNGIGLTCIAVLQVEWSGGPEMEQQAWPLQSQTQAIAEYKHFPKARAPPLL